MVPLCPGIPAVGASRRIRHFENLKSRLHLALSRCHDWDDRVDECVRYRREPRSNRDRRRHGEIGQRRHRPTTEQHLSVTSSPALELSRRLGSRGPDGVFTPGCVGLIEICGGSAGMDDLRREGSLGRREPGCGSRRCPQTDRSPNSQLRRTPLTSAVRRPKERSLLALPFAVSSRRSTQSARHPGCTESCHGEGLSPSMNLRAASGTASGSIWAARNLTVSMARSSASFSHTA